MSIQDSIDAALALLPKAGTEIPYEEFRSSVLKTGDPNANQALQWILTKSLVTRRMTVLEGNKPQLLVSRPS